MAFRLKLVPENTKWDFFSLSRITFGVSSALVIASIVAWLVVGLNYGIDFKGGTTIRTEATNAVDAGAYRDAIAPLGLGDVLVTEVFDPTFRADQNVAQIRIQAQEGEDSVSPEMVAKVEAAVKAVDPTLKFTSVESVGAKVSAELIWQAIIAVGLACLGIGIYVWLRFEWQFAVGSFISLLHDVFLTIGVFVLFQIKFDLTIIAALLTIVGYSINDTVVVFDRVRENLIKYKTMPLRDVMNLSINETMSRTVMTGGTTILALIVLMIFGGDVLRGFVFAMTWGILVGTYSSVYIATNWVLFLGVKRDWSKPADTPAGTQFTTADK